MRSALERGLPDFVAGHDVITDVLEAAWPDAKVAVLRSDQQFDGDGWNARHAQNWTVEELVAAVTNPMTQE